jgi:hypothetical protein
MNGYWNTYCAFTKDGRAKPGHSTADFKKAFARIYLIVHGGPAVGYGAPDIPANRAQAYYPGDKFVDVVGNDLYDQGGKAEWAANEALYNAHPSKPYAIPEWGLWGIDDPLFVLKMAAFVKTHGRVELVSYFNSKPGSTFDLASKPKSLAAYRKAITPLGP